MSHTVNVIAFPGAPNLPIFVARDKGFFVRHGIDLGFETTPSSASQFERMSAGDFDIAMTAFDNVVAYAEGQGAVELTGRKDFRVLLGATQIELSFVTSPDISDYADLKGKSLSLDALATGFAFVLYEMLSRNGISKHEVSMVETGATPQRWAAVRDGEHAGTLTIEPFTSIATGAGFRVLDSSSRFLDHYQGGIVAASHAWAHAHPDAVRSWMTAYLEGLRWTLDPANREEAKQILLTNMPAIKAPVADAVMNSLLSQASGLTPRGELLRAGMETVLRLRSTYSGGRELTDVDRYLDMSFRDDLVAAMIHASDSGTT